MLSLRRKHLGPVPFSEGHRLLWAAIERSKIQSITAAADLMGCSPGALSKLLYAERAGGMTMAKRCFDAFDIPFSSWSKPPTRAFTLPAAA